MERGEEKEEKRNITKRYRVMIYHAYDMWRIFGEDIKIVELILIIMSTKASEWKEMKEKEMDRE